MNRIKPTERIKELENENIFLRAQCAQYMQENQKLTARVYELEGEQKALNLLFARLKNSVNDCNEVLNKGKQGVEWPG